MEEKIFDKMYINKNVDLRKSAKANDISISQPQQPTKLE